MTRTFACIAVVAAMGSFPLAAQTSKLSPEAVQKLDGIADQVKDAIQQGDLNRAMRLSSELALGILHEQKQVEPTPRQKLEKLEQGAAPAGAARFDQLAPLAKAAFDAGELDRAEQYARELLQSATDKKHWNYGNAIFFGNMVIGRVALRRDKNVALAKASLLASGQTPGSPQLNSFGPNMSLAKDLLSAGERDAVVEFFTECRAFWKMQLGKLDEWTATVKGGGVPEFGANLVY